ncbi:uncharacterized protein LOC123302206 [Chrysoperla carnea]|uniref:uncharacterized protein LOC123302206 n=1 Tax=Chrysoperla carnea TaxID=189513 RepID=UPI001D0627B0|nr:uncharacterized protein LOC123302206 [Chrysoperla carnea]
MSGEFILSEMVSNNLADEGLLNSRSGLINQEIEEAAHLNQFECDVCKIFITCSSDEFRKHFTEKDHLQNVYKLYQNQAKSVKGKATDNQIECAVCKIYVLEAKFQAHIKGKNHQSKLKRVEKIKLNQVKHPLKKDSELLFEKVKTNQTKCEICKIIIRNDLLLSHIHGKKHKNNLIEWNLNLPPDEKSDQNQMDDDISEIPCKRRRLQEDINEEHYQRTKPVKNRLQEQLHSQSIEESNDNQNQCKETENDPHDHINSHESNLFQEYLKPFEQICDNQIQCNICQVIIPRNLNYEAHQNATAHQANAYQLSNLKVKQKTRIQNQVYCVICKQPPKDSNRLKDHVHGTNHRNKLIDINVFLLQYVKQTIDIPVQLEEDLISNNMNVSPINPRVYLTDAYTLYLTKDDIPRPLTIQKISPEYFKCLVCKILFLENSLLNDHVVSDTHQRNYNDKYKQLALISFHTIWRSVPPIIQGQQIFFYPHDRKNIYCILCSLTLDCVFIKSHCKNKVHVQGVKDGGHLWSEIDESLYHKISAQYK